MKSGRPSDELLAQGLLLAGKGNTFVLVLRFRGSCRLMTWLNCSQQALTPEEIDLNQLHPLFRVFLSVDLLNGVF